MKYGGFDLSLTGRRGKPEGEKVEELSEAMYMRQER